MGTDRRINLENAAVRGASPRLATMIGEIKWKICVAAAVVWQRWITSVRYPANFTSSLMSPFVSLAVSVFMAKAFSSSPADVTAASGNRVGNHDYRSFLLVSTVLWTYIQSQLYLGFSLQSEMRRGTAEIVLMSPASRWAYLTGNAAYQFLRSTVNVIATVILGVASFGVSGFLGGTSWLRTLGIAALDLVAVYGYGLVLSGLLVVFRSDIFSYVWDCLLPLLVGSMFSVTVLPPVLRRLSMAIPLTYGLDLLRWSVSGYPTILAPATEACILAVSAIALPLLGYFAFMTLERVARARGTLGQF